jgi:hypothetical protein
VVINLALKAGLLSADGPGTIAVEDIAPIGTCDTNKRR